MNPLKNPVRLAVIGAAHGIKGAVKVKTFTEDPLAIGRYGPLSDSAGRRFEVAEARPQGSGVVATFKGIADRNAAEALTGTALFVDRSALPGGLEEDEFYHTDLVGLSALDLAGSTLGKVAAVHNFGSGDILEIALAAGGSALIPFTAAAVPQVAVGAGLIRIDPAAAGLAAEDDAGQDGPFDPSRRARGPSDAGGNR
jgi:16S rRNA processing protein RimM